MSVVRIVLNLTPLLLLLVAIATGVVTFSMPLLAGCLAVSEFLCNLNTTPSALRLSKKFYNILCAKI